MVAASQRVAWRGMLFPSSRAACACAHARAVLRELKLTVSVGAAPNRLMAKLASGAAKPNSVRLVADQQAALQLLAQVSALDFRV